MESNKALVSMFIALLISILVGVNLLSDSSTIARSLASPTLLSAPAFPHYVHRAVSDEIVLAASSGRKFVVVEGGEDTGKTVAVRAAAARLSASRTVLWTQCTTSSTLDTVLQRLYGLRRSQLVDYLLNPRPSAELEEFLLSRAATQPEPVLVVDKAELLPLQDLKNLVNFAKKMCHAGLGRFILILSPSDKMTAVSTLGAMAAGRIITVLDLPRSEALELLGHTCTPERAATVYSLVGGHLPHLLEEEVASFCAGTLDKGGLTAAFYDKVHSRLSAVEWQLPCNKCACPAACAMLNKQWGDSDLIAARPLLLEQQIARHSLLHGGYRIDTPVVLHYIEQQCSCTAHEPPRLKPGAKLDAAAD